VIANDASRLWLDPAIESPKAAHLAAVILRSEHFAQDAGGKLYVYRNGVYVKDGKATVGKLVKAILHQAGLAHKWSSHLAEETAEYIRVSAPALWERPLDGTLNLRNGLLTVKSRDLQPHDPTHLSAVQLPVVYDSAATCPCWEKQIKGDIPGGCCRRGISLADRCLLDVADYVDPKGNLASR
jgi:D5 N terminal like